MVWSLWSSQTTAQAGSKERERAVAGMGSPISRAQLWYLSPELGHVLVSRQPPVGLEVAMVTSPTPSLWAHTGSVATGR